MAYQWNFGPTPVTAGQLNFGTPVAPVTGAAAAGPVPGAPMAAPQWDPAQLSQIAAAASGPQAGMGQWWNRLGGLEGLGTMAQGFASLGGLYASLKGIGLARDQMKLSKEAYETNLANSTKSYNTTLEDRIRRRASYTGEGSEMVDSYLKKHAL